ncbi:protein kinase domain-containing protein [Massilia niabensis]|uniref:Serine/threonine protein kinase n=1 Tax=Massilia niabensis TaxID=544910 RepID=A0ABW0L2G1_9BURK
MVQSGDIVTLAAGHYRLRGQLAASSYGVVWRAECIGFGVGEVALKLVNREQMARAEPSLRERWRACAEREIAFLSQLTPWDARHIVRLLDHGVHDGLPAMALELLDGDLSTHMAAQAGDGRRIGLGQSLAWLAQVNAALAKVHQHGWRYLDLKPANLLLDKASRTLKLADFGTNRSLLDAAAHSYAGTASWQAPEQFFPSAPQAYLTDARTDYFALGAVFFYMVTNGATLRYSGACADAWRAHGLDGAARLREACGGALPPVLCEDEAAHFLRCAGSGDGSGDGNPGAALALLRALLAGQREHRPRHALEISRMIAAAQGGLGFHDLRRAA